MSPSTWIAQKAHQLPTSRSVRGRRDSGIWGYRLPVPSAYPDVDSDLLDPFSRGQNSATIEATKGIVVAVTRMLTTPYENRSDMALPGRSCHRLKV
jgi:hypothetical protein